ncbi:MAG TPA: ABC transporter ATP-binding protein [Anaerohalosphaeraceae bacterium]|jgi:ABC-type lipoprotein export system ATPase subunit|nr:ABC transporter ATP-binding protein [Anaerohalosphaeraceae bacterium]HPB93157.1 ABC transporter ATP-binding protein [Anaerohalosphaeraceae bacterium]HRT22548.1 ABC transporter ATP-binding protein [Anaerohalosphaeraceae bacterium]HRU14283.1 ABC transporter ATP-binding protein [Anaerohalosphaeraceae bacterium]
MNALIAARNIHKSYPMGKQMLHVLKGVSLQAQAGSFIAIVGASGSGKSTLLHILGTLDKPDQGSVEFEGKDLSRLSAGRLNKYRNRSVGFIFQFYHLLNELNVLENTLLPTMISNGSAGYLRRKKELQDSAAALLERLGLSGRLRHRPFELSGGERQRVAIARALMNKPALLLADEPTGNLDSKTGSGILEILKELNRAGQTIILVTHDVRIAQEAGEIVRLEDGKIVQ